ncbi:MAG: MgtC/SapB family protein [Clostridia bacterium]|nr:MgtC/SapB family protein [Clostridia bacterium]
MSIEFGAVLRILMALVCGGIIGYEREYKNRPAGLRTHMLVCIGSALVMITSQYLYEKYAPGTMDPARLGAQVISGIGFLGAGTIIRERFSVKGLTTAATLWVVACIGIAIGSGYFILAGIATLVSFISLILFRKLESILKIKPASGKVRITAAYSKNIDAEIKKTFEESGYKVSGMKFSKSPDMKTVAFTFDASCPGKHEWDELSRNLYLNESIIKADIEF